MTTKPVLQIGRVHSSALPRRARRLALWSALALAVAGCQGPMPQFKDLGGVVPEHPQAVTMREGDVVLVTFSISSNLNTRQQIRMDGNVSLPLIGELKVVGMTAPELKASLTNRYASQITPQDIEVVVESSSFVIYVSGAVLRPGPFRSQRPITALEAIMEAGGPDFTKANLKAVKIIRHEAGGLKNFTLNLKLAFQGKSPEPFYLKPSDIVYVPERFSWL